jgi:hypothetical protein
VLKGSKGVVLNGGNADFLVVSARTSGDETDRDGISLFLVPTDADGMTRTHYPTVDGHQAAEVELDDVRVPATHLLGEAGSAFDVIDAVTDDATPCSVRRSSRHHATHDPQDRRVLEKSRAVRGSRSAASRPCSTAWWTC